MRAGREIFETDGVRYAVKRGECRACAFYDGSEEARATGNTCRAPKEAPPCWCSARADGNAVIFVRSGRG